jgi:hypothetical protein
MSDGEWMLRDTERGRAQSFGSRADAESARDDMVALGRDAEEFKVVSPSGDGVDGPDGAEGEPVPEPDGGAAVVETQPEAAAPESLSKDPIAFLEGVNPDFVNVIKGTPAISKQGFRFLQREFEISTESEVVQWIDDPLGCVVWAKAQLPSGYSAEAHGEGWQFEGDVSDNEFVRYADTRAKNRAISDLTSAGALAVSELQQ